MSLFKCKMCGGDLEVNVQMSVCECQYCGSRQTLPKLGSEKKNNLYDRAGHFRRNNEYDKAMSIYEQILSEEPEDAESYWSLVLCRYGIEYVEDPATHKRVPTVNRAQFTSIFSDEDYKSALKYADAEQRAVYEAEAREIEQIQKGILAISNQEEAFDVFICYKESDANGRRTPDSVLANDLYHQLTQEGFRVFFARITLEDKLGSAYEPYIFAALNSAKVMVVLGTKPEYFNAVWVKNEWSRYLALIRGGAKKILIPAYKDMDPYDLPEEFSHLQAQDMSKLGFMQDLIRGIKKLAGEKEGKKEDDNRDTVASSGAEPLLKRAFMFLEDGEFEKADEFCEQALNLDPENALAYVGKLMAELRVKKQEELGNCEEKLTEKNYFQKAIRFAKDSLKTELERCNQMILDRENDSVYEVASSYLRLSDEMNLKEIVIQLDKAIEAFSKIRGWRDSEEKLSEAETRKNELCGDIYSGAKKAFDLGMQAKKDEKKKLAILKDAIAGFSKIEGYRDSEDLFQKAFDEYIRVKKKRRRKLIYKTAICAIGIFDIVVLLQIGTSTIKEKIQEKKYKEHMAYCEEKYKEAMAYMEGADYYEASQIFDELKDYKDSEEKNTSIKVNWYYLAEDYMEQEEYEDAIELYEMLGAYGQSLELLEECKSKLEEITAAKEEVYRQAVSYREGGEYKKAINKFKEIEGYKDSDIRKVECENLYAEEQYQKAINEIKVGGCIEFGRYEQDGEISNGKEIISWYVLDMTEEKALLLSTHALDCKPYNETIEEVTWETCSLRTWLNYDFYDSAFTKSEKSKIVESNIKNQDNPLYGTEGGNDTKDRVFLLSIDEVKKYSEWIKTPDLITEYAIDNGVSVCFTGGRYCSFASWLRTIGRTSQYATYVLPNTIDINGYSRSEGFYIYEYGEEVGIAEYAVWPAIWVELGGGTKQ